MKTSRLVSAFFVVFFVFPSTTAMSAEQKRPNILFIFTDDHAYQAIGAYGSNRNETPNMDRLAAEGMRFTNCCVTNSICGPSRAVIQTGKYSHKNGFLSNANRFDADQQTFPKLLQQSGYQTAIVGKWHLVSEVKGYDYSEVLVDQGPYYNPPMIKNGEKVQHQGLTTEIITELTLDWLENGRDKSKPFLLMSQHKAPHREWDPYPKHYEKYKNVEFPYPKTFDDDWSGRGRAALEQDMTIADTLTARDLKLETPYIWETMSDEQKADWHQMFDVRKEEYAAVKDDPKALKRWKYQCYMKDYMSCVAAVDDGIGQLLKYLDENGLAENTVVVYASDQGFYLGEHGWFDKRFMYNESFKTPLIVRWPGHAKPGSVNDDIVSNVDFAETFLDLAGIPAPPDMQGRSLVPILEGKTPADWRGSLYYHYYEYPDWHMVKKHEGVYDGRFKLIHFYDDIDEWELYDLQADPDEMRSVYDDPGYSDEIKRLETELERLKTELDVPKVEVGTKSRIFGVNKKNPWTERLQRVIPERIEKQKARRLLDEQARKAFEWFKRYRVEKTGLVLDRGRNSLEEDNRTLSSIASGGYYLSFLPEAIRLGWIDENEAARQVKHMLDYSLEKLPHDRGFFYHFYNAATGERAGKSEISVLDTAIYLNGVMVASTYFGNERFGAEIAETAEKLLDRVEWPALEMTDPISNKKVLSMAVHEGKLGFHMGIRSSEFLMPYWLAVGSKTHPVDPQLWYNCRISEGELSGRKVVNPGSPLFLSYYSLAWQDLEGLRDTDGLDLFENARLSALANRDFCRERSARLKTYSHENGSWWGLSAGDSPKGYVAQGANDKVDGTVWPVTALAAMTFIPDEIDADIVRWSQSPIWSKIDGPYGLSPFNLENGWIAPDLIGIDLGSFLLDWANRRNGTIQDLWMRHPVAKNGGERLGIFKKSVP